MILSNQFLAAPIITFGVVGLSLALGSCASRPQPTGTDPWSYSTPEQQGFDSEVLVDLLETIESDKLDIHSIVLMRKDHVFLEFYNYPYGPETPQFAASVGKSVLSALVGIALDNGQLKGLDTPLLDSFPEYTSIAANSDKAQITLRDALTMQAGLDVGDDKKSILSSIMSSDSWINATWAQDMVQTAGQSYNYSSFVSHLIAQATERAITGDMTEFARNELFDPIGIGQVQTRLDPENQWFGGAPLWMTSRDMLRFGRLYLENGRWDGEQVLPKRWVKDSTQNQIGNQPTNSGIEDARYGYHWWVFEGAYAAIGAGGQMIMVIPELDLVAVITSAEPEFDLIDDYVLKALKSVFWKARANPDAVAELDLLIETMAEQRPYESDEPPALARAISGQRFEVVSSNAPTGVMLLRSFTLTVDESPNPASLQLEFAEGTLEVRLGVEGAPQFSKAEFLSQRPDNAGLIAASARWTDNHALVVNLHEMGYPIKDRWSITFDEQGAKLKIQARGAAVGGWTYVAKSTPYPFVQK